MNPFSDICGETAQIKERKQKNDCITSAFVIALTLGVLFGCAPTGSSIPQSSGIESQAAVSDFQPESVNSVSEEITDAVFDGQGQSPTVKLVSRKNDGRYFKLVIQGPQTAGNAAYRAYPINANNVIVRYIYDIGGEHRLFLVRFNPLTGETVKVYDGACTDTGISVVKGIGNSFAACFEGGYMLFKNDELAASVTDDKYYWCTVSPDFENIVYCQQSDAAAVYVLEQRESNNKIHVFSNETDDALPAFSPNGDPELIRLRHNDVLLEVYDNASGEIKSYSIDTELPDELEYCELFWGNNGKVYFTLDEAVSYVYSVELKNGALTQEARVAVDTYAGSPVLNFVFNQTEYAFVKPTVFPLQEPYIVRCDTLTGEVIDEIDARKMGDISDICYLSDGSLIAVLAGGQTVSLERLM